mmetsp:Transcript_8716/g.11008  ORF Transcript_8716/g.11008 Transcript_8716/m.11008 type:complete len:158 (+) Transcript_8716:1433-1906(+)
MLILKIVAAYRIWPGFATYLETVIWVQMSHRRIKQTHVWLKGFFGLAYDQRLICFCRAGTKPLLRSKWLMSAIRLPREMTCKESDENHQSKNITLLEFVVSKNSLLCCKAQVEVFSLLQPWLKVKNLDMSVIKLSSKTTNEHNVTIISSICFLQRKY